MDRDHNWLLNYSKPESLCCCRSKKQKSSPLRCKNSLANGCNEHTETSRNVMLKFLMSCSDTAVIYLLWRREKKPTWTSEVWFILNRNKEMYQSEQIQLHASTRLQTCYNQATEDNQAEWNITLHGARIWSANTILIKPRLCASLISVTQYRYEESKSKTITVYFLFLIISAFVLGWYHRDQCEQTAQSCLPESVTLPPK